MVVAGASMPPPDPRDGDVERGDLPRAGRVGAEHEVALAQDAERVALGCGDALDVEVDGGGGEHDRTALVAESDHRDRLRGDVQVAGDLGEPLVDHHGTVRARDAGERAGAEERREVAGGLGATERVDRRRGQVVADHLEDGLGLFRRHLGRRSRAVGRHVTEPQRHVGVGDDGGGWRGALAVVTSAAAATGQRDDAGDHEHAAGDTENKASIRLGLALAGLCAPIGARSCRPWRASG